MLWEGRHSWLIDSEVKNKIKELGGTLVAKSLSKDPARAATIWRLSLNSSPIFDKVFKHLSQQGCNAKTVLKLIKDIKKIAFEDKERSILKSYNVRQALLHCADELGGQKVTEASLLIAIMEKVSFFLEKAFFPSFLEEKRNLIFNWSAEQCSEGNQKLQEVVKEVPRWVWTVNQEQKTKKAELSCRSSRLTREISPILGFKPLIHEYLSAEFVNRVCRTLFISRPARDSLKECIGKFVQSLSKYLLDANKNVNMLDSFELD